MRRKVTASMPHERGASWGDELAALRKEAGWAGVGVYWALAECIEIKGGALPMSEIEAIAKKMELRKDTIERVVRACDDFFEREGALRSHRVDAAIKQRERVGEARRKVALLRWNGGARLTPDGVTLSPKPSPEPSPAGGDYIADSAEMPPLFPADDDPTYAFERVWELYGRVGNKKLSRRRWERLHARSKKKCLEALPAYIASTPAGLYRKNFETYLHQEAWEDAVRPIGVAKYLTPAPAMAGGQFRRPIEDYTGVDILD